MPDNVIYGGGYIHYIKSKTTPVLSKYDVNEITQKIESNRLVASYKTNRDHIRHVKDIIKRKESKAPPTNSRSNPTMALKRIERPI